MSDREFERAVIDWLEDGTDRTPKRAIDGVLLAVKTTPQERDLRIPWRLPFMTAIPRATGIAAVALVAVVGVGAVAVLNNRAPVGPGAASPSAPPATTAPSISPSADPSADPGTTGWAPYTSGMYGITVDHPEGWDVIPATREWQEGDTPEQAEAYADRFASETDDIAFGVFRMRAGADADLGTVEGLQAFAVAYCESQRFVGCDTLTDRTVELCADGEDPCRPAILLRSEDVDPAEEGTYAFVPEADGTSVIVVTAYRGEGWPGAARFDGTSGLLLSAMAPMGVTLASTLQSEVAPGITSWAPFTSPVYGYTMGYPEGWSVTEATRERQPGAGIAAGTEDQFVDPAGELGYTALRVPVGEGADVESVAGLTAWARQYCTDLGLAGCDTFEARTEPLCLNAAGDTCRAAILVRSEGTDPEEEGEFAFFPAWDDVAAGGTPDMVNVVAVARGDAFPGAAQYGGAVQLLLSVIAQVGVKGP